MYFNMKKKQFKEFKKNLDVMIKYAEKWAVIGLLFSIIMGFQTAVA